MRLTVVGCTGSLPGPTSPASCYLVSHDGFRLVVDLGSGAYGPLQRYVGLAEIGAIALSHLHADHCLDVTAAYVEHAHGPLPGGPRIDLIAPPGAADRLARAYDLDPDPGMTEQFRFHEWEQRQQIGPFTVTTAALVHPVPMFGLRIEAGGRVLCYSGDTAPTDALVELARDADLALFEASFEDGWPDLPEGLHMTASQAGEHAERAGAKRLVLTHLPPWVDPVTQLETASRTFSGGVSLASAGAVYQI